MFGWRAPGQAGLGRREAELKDKGVEFTEAPEQRPCGIDCGFRDPSGNSLRLTQLMEDPA